MAELNPPSLPIYDPELRILIDACLLKLPHPLFFLIPSMSLTSFLLYQLLLAYVLPDLHNLKHIMNVLADHRLHEVPPEQRGLEVLLLDAEVAVKGATSFHDCCLETRWHKVLEEALLCHIDRAVRGVEGAV